MALIIEANYSKKLGLPGYSSHQYRSIHHSRLPALFNLWVSWLDDVARL